MCEVNTIQLRCNTGAQASTISHSHFLHVWTFVKLQTLFSDFPLKFRHSLFKTRINIRCYLWILMLLKGWSSVFDKDRNKDIKPVLCFPNTWWWFVPSRLLCERKHNFAIELILILSFKCSVRFVFSNICGLLYSQNTSRKLWSM